MTPDQARENIADGMKMVRDGTHALITAELAELWDLFVSNEESAAAELADALTALEGPQHTLADIRVQIDHAEAKALDWQFQLDSEFSDDRLQANMWFAQWNDELTRLRQKYDWAEQDRVPLVEARNTARAKLARARDMKERLAMNMLLPFEGLGRARKPISRSANSVPGSTAISRWWKCSRKCRKARCAPLSGNGYVS